MRHGFLVIDKPEGITSHDVVAAVRAVTGFKKVGHTGTLDPFATGVLALALGGATRLVQYLDESVKIYDATIQLGTEMDTGDPTGEVIAEAPIPELTSDQVESVLASFVGDRMQKPPRYSAVKVNGKPLYYYARKGIEVDVQARPITIRDMRLESLEPGQVRVTISCSRGTYARVIATEVAEALGTKGHLNALSRARSGPFHLEDALTMDELARIVSGRDDLDWRDVLLSRRGRREDRVPWRPRADVLADLQPYMARTLDMLGGLPLLDVDAAEATRVRNGGVPQALPGGLALGGRFLVVDGADLVAVAEASQRGPRVLKVLPA